MRKFPAIPLFLTSAVVLAACGGSDRCEAPKQPARLAAKDLTLVQKADALGVPPSRVPAQGALPEYEDYVTRINDSAEAEYCVENEAYKARAMKGEMTTDVMATMARAVAATCKVTRQEPVLASILKYRNCASGHE